MIKRSVILIHLILILQSTSGQSKYYDHNKSQIRLLKKTFDTSCKDYNSERPISKKMIKWDKKIIPFLNELYNKDLSLTEIQANYENISAKELNFRFDQIIDLGGFKRYESGIFSKGNLRVSVLLIVCDDKILYKKIYIETNRFTICFNPSIFGISYYDVKYLEEDCLPLIDFPISIEQTRPALSIDKTYFENLNILKGRGYRGFEIDTSKHLDDLIFFENTNYGFKSPSLAVTDLYKNNRTDQLSELLYAPNHIVALNAMEALVALNKIKNLPLTTNILNKMEEVKNSDLKISWRSSDVFYHSFKSYKELNLSENSILEKYKAIK